jgi:diaminopimelate epimerase
MLPGGGTLRVRVGRQEGAETIQPVQFTKLSGSGNDFVCIDSRDGRYNELLDDPQRLAHFCREICRRGIAIGADGVVFALPSEMPDHADVLARFLEADGSEAELCGNGTACFVAWMLGERGPHGPELHVLTSAGIVRGRNSDGLYVRVCIPLPEDIRIGMPLSAGNMPMTCDFAVTGVPHVVKYVNDIDAVDVDRVGRQIRHHERFQPRGANVNFVQILGEGEIALRTFEFGVEAETLACGTGSASAAVLAAMRHQWSKEYFRAAKPVLVHARSGDVLRIYFEADDDGTITDLCLETVVRRVYDGVLHPELAEKALNGIRQS